jgi:hypothetical protein
MRHSDAFRRLRNYQLLIVYLDQDDWSWHTRPVH